MHGYDGNECLSKSYNVLESDLKPQHQTIEMTVDEWTAKFKPIKNMFEDDAPFEGCMFETYGQELDFVIKQDNNCIWTNVDVEDGVEISEGYHLVNRLGYFVTEIPRDNDYFYLIT
ncbi:MAG: hypothetical protein HRU28_11420 [Rhizobiales bacterium]|nr:hypothetical protein [Hyphomicrobiales bacterium]